MHMFWDMLGNSLQIICWCDFSDLHSQNEIESDGYCVEIDYTQKWIIVKLYFKYKEKTLKDTCRHSPSGVINSLLAKHEVYVNEKRWRILKIMTFKCRFQTRCIAPYILVKQAIIDLSMIYKSHMKKLFFCGCSLKALNILRSLRSQTKLILHCNITEISLIKSQKRNQNRDKRDICWDTVRICMEL